MQPPLMPSFCQWQRCSTKQIIGRISHHSLHFSCSNKSVSSTRTLMTTQTNKLTLSPPGTHFLSIDLFSFFQKFARVDGKADVENVDGLCWKSEILYSRMRMCYSVIWSLDVLYRKMPIKQRLTRYRTWREGNGILRNKWEVLSSFSNFEFQIAK